MDEKLIDIFTKCCEQGLVEEGVPSRCVWNIEGGDKINIGILQIPPQDVMKFAINCLLCNGAKELVFGLDRYSRNKESQGLETDDILTVFHFDHHGWHYGILEYQYEPRIWKEIDWTNEFWNSCMELEIIRFFERAFLKVWSDKDEEEA